MKRLEKAAEAIAKSILRCESLRVISHNDADGITSAGLICNALIREDIPFHATLLNRLDASVVDSIQSPVIFCDMGSGKPELISHIRESCFVLDHHKPVGKLSCMHLNPHQFGIDGAFELSASGTVYSIVRQMGDNKDLAGLALVGAMGDRQGMIGANRTILEEAREAGAVDIKPGVKMARDGSLEDVFSESLEPLLDFTGNHEKAREFLSSLGLKGDIQDLAGEDLSRLSTALVLKLLVQGSMAADSIIGEVIRLKREVVENSLELVQLLNACGNRDLPGLGLALCLRDKSYLTEARKLAAEYEKHILREIKILHEEHKDLKNIRYLLMENMESGAVICGLGIRYLYTDRPLLTLNRKNEEVKISARGNKLLVANGLDLSLALRKAAEAVGGVGGGHNIASGASIPQGTEDKFLAIVDESVGEQLKGQGKL
ncbi:MAG: DHH family phosphoesterase [Methanotrichaceae archaeon]|nr:DHH family phosphoesterase [Methanotrichaceae archaeon]